ncbi:HMG-box [Sistotremastrum niveocremeum HHB9708]|uniref:HMG-box n=1 Tax=Sistotremastrum niveocremeum HHB9708 TaxID=1314777 RepID=A0A164TTP4_9AGAM|nr:HMG-box [Sistotremastrum niveocremeum HHB9708]
MRQCADLASHFSALLKGEPPGAVKDSHTFQNAFAPVPPPNDLQGPPTPIEHQGSAGEKKSRQNASTEGDGGKRKRIKKEKKEKDPDLPKRPPSAYLMFQNEVRAGFKTQFPGLAYHQVLGKISEAWSTMPDKEKERYKDMVSVDKARYDEELNTYNTNKGIKAAEASAAAAIEAGPAVPVAKPKSAVKEVQKETPVSDEDSSSEDDSSDESSEDEQEPEQPPPKKSKKSHDEKKKHSSK